MEFYPGFQIPAEYVGWPDDCKLLYTRPIKHGRRLQVAHHPKQGVKVYDCGGLPLPWVANIEFMFAEFRRVIPVGYMFDGVLTADDWLNLSMLLQRDYSLNSFDDIELLEQHMKFLVFDMVKLLHSGQYRHVHKLNAQSYYVSQSARLKLLGTTIPNQARYLRVQEISVVSSKEELNSTYAAAVNGGDIGVVVEIPSAPYVFGDSPFWLSLEKKVVHAGTVVECVGVSSLKHLIVRTDDGKLVKVCVYLTDVQREVMWVSRDVMPGRRIEFAYNKNAVQQARHGWFVGFIE